MGRMSFAGFFMMPDKFLFAASLFNRTPSGSTWRRWPLPSAASEAPLLKRMAWGSVLGEGGAASEGGSGSSFGIMACAFSTLRTAAPFSMDSRCV